MSSFNDIFQSAVELLRLKLIQKPQKRPEVIKYWRLQASLLLQRGFRRLAATLSTDTSPAGHFNLYDSHAHDGAAVNRDCREMLKIS